MRRISRVRLLAASCAAALFAAAPFPAIAQDATWLAAPPGNDFNSSANWSPALVPTGTASFDTSSQTIIGIGSPVSLNQMDFATTAPAYTFTVSSSLGLNGAGVTDESANAPLFNIGSTGSITFTNSAAAADAQLHVTGGGLLDFQGGANAANAVITADASAVEFEGTASGGSAQIHFSDGTLEVQNAASGGTATITLDSSSLFFDNNGTGGSASITLSNFSFGSFADNSTGGNAALSVDVTSSIDFSDSNGPNGDGKLSVGSLSGAGTIFLGSNALTLGGDNSSTSFSGSIGDCEIGGNFCSNFGATGGSLVKAGTGTFTLGGSNSYTGGTVVQGGTLAISADDNLGTGGTLELDAGTTLQFAGDGSFSSHAVTIAGDPTFDTHFHIVTWSSDISDGATPGDLTVTGGGTLRLGGDNSYTGATTITGSTNVIADSDTALGSNSAVSIGNGALDLHGHSLTIGSLSDLSGVGGEIATTSAAASTLTIGGDNSDTTFSGGIFNGSGTLALTKTGSGTLTLAGTSNYSGATSVQSGTLAVNGAIASSAVTVGNGGTLTGDGTVGAAHVQSGGTLLPGGIGATSTLTVDGNLTLDAGANYVDFLAPGGVTGLTSVTGTASIDGTLFANFAGGSYTASTQYTLITSTGTLSGTFANLDALGTPSGFHAMLAYDNNDVYLELLPNAFIWSASPPTSNWNAGFNWSFGAVPTGTDTAIFDATSGSGVTISQATSVKSLQFNAGAPAYSFAITGTSGGGAASLTVNNGGIVDNSSNAPTFNVSGISGDTGTLTFAGTGSTADAHVNAGAFGTVAFTGNTDAGAMAVLTAQSGGTINFSGTAGATGNHQIAAGSIAGAGNFILGSNTLTQGALNTSTEVSGDISGSGGLIKVGSGTLTLSGTNDYTGATMVNGGILDVNGTAAHSAVTVNSGTLMGHGTVGGVTLASGGTIAPGNSIGTINVASIAFGTGSFYQVEANAAGQSDLINDTGAATLTGGTVQALPAAGSYAPLTIYHILNAAGGVTGSFANVTSSIADLTPSLVYSANGVDLHLLKNDVQFGGFGTTPNQVAAGGAVTAGGAASTLYGAVAAASGTAASASAALSSLTGEIYASLRAALTQDGDLIRHALIGHLESDKSDGVQLWGTGFAGYGWFDGNGNAADMHHNSAGFIAGIDMPVGDGFRLGLAGAATGGSLSIPDRASRAGGNGGHVIGYASWNNDALALRLGADYGWGHETIERQVAFLSETDSARQGNHIFQSFADAGYRFTLTNLSVEPYFGLDRTELGTGAFAESGGAISALSGGAQTSTVSYDTIGVRGAGNVLSLGGGMAITPRFDLGWQHAFDALRPDQLLAFKSSGASFTVLGVPPGSDAALVQLGFDLRLCPDASLALDYDGLFLGHGENHALRARLNWKF